MGRRYQNPYQSIGWPLRAGTGIVRSERALTGGNARLLPLDRLVFWDFPQCELSTRQQALALIESTALSPSDSAIYCRTDHYPLPMHSARNLLVPIKGKHCSTVAYRTMHSFRHPCIQD